MRFLLILAALLLPAQAWAALALDGHATGSANTNKTSATATLTTTQTNDVVIACVGVNSVSTTAVTVSTITDGAGLTWTKRSSVGGADSNSHYDDLECWWAASSGSLTSDVITVTTTASTDTIAIYAFGISGANTSSPFDTNASLPKAGTNLTATSTNPTVSAFSTTSTNTFAFAVMTTNSNASGSLPSSAPTGWTNLDTLSFNGSASFNDGQNAYDVYGAAQSSLTLTFGSGTFYTADWLMLADAVVAGSAPANSPHMRTLLGVGK